ncbi:MAG: DUF3800 domain-containing protein [Candidatus Poribacteria bacterium]|nr:DUF3800 domain-containing protein [Candidatus Poribacteria bacterium]
MLRKLGSIEVKRIDLWVDESGQDTRGKLFIVAGAVVAAENRDEARQFYASLEKISGKGKVKWAAADKNKRLTYLHTAIQEAAALDVTLFYSEFHQTTDYDGATVEGIARIVHKLHRSASRIYVHVDGLTESKCSDYRVRLRRLGCRRVRDVRGIRKRQNEPLIRLADALAGGIGASRKHQNSQLAGLLSQAEKDGILVKL